MVSIDTIDLGEPKPNHVRLVIGQLLMDFADLIRRDGLYFPKDPAAVWVRLQLILQDAAAVGANLVVLPELSVPEELLPLLQEWGKSNKCIVVAGSHYWNEQSGYVARCPILIGGSQYFSFKLHPAPSEVSPIHGLGVQPGPKACILRNTSVGDLAVLICSDFLTPEIRHAVLSEGEGIDILCVIACQKSSDWYHPRMSQDCEDSKVGLYIAYANLLGQELADGRSALFGQMDRLYMDSLKEASFTDGNPKYKLCELYGSGTQTLVAELDLVKKRPSLVRNVETRPNVMIFPSPSRSPSSRTSALDSVQHPRYKLVAFDLDGTLLRGLQFSWTLVWRHLGIPEHVRGGLMRDYLSRKIDYDQWCSRACELFIQKGLKREDFGRIAKTVKLTNNFYQAISRLKESGIILAIISGGIDALLKDMIEDCEKIFDYIFINRLLFDGFGKLVQVIATKYDFEGKALALELICAQRNIDLSETVFVGDEFNDAYGISCAGLSIAYSSRSALVQETAKHVIEEDDLNLILPLILRD
jgi:HAD superfamily phosphoserine phosphatase-like hydrolase